MPLYTFEQLLNADPEELKRSDARWRANRIDRNKFKPPPTILWKELKGSKSLREKFVEMRSQEQDDVCAICGRGDRKLVIDHSHETDMARGLLCVSCNAGLGMLKESIEYLCKAILYLLHYSN